LITARLFREARPGPAAWNLAKMAALMALLWATCFVALPVLCYLAEPALGLDAYRFSSPGWSAAGAALFLLASGLHLAANLALTLRGDGTPWYGDAPRRLVVAGPYRHVRNPIAVASLGQMLGAALFLGSPLALLYAAAAALLEDFALRPAEEADLERRFGDAYRRYRRRVRCWRWRWPGYDPGREAAEPPVAAERTTPPGRNLVLYDGHCKFCKAGAQVLPSLARPGAIELVDFQEPGVLERLPGISHEACMRQMYLVTAEGRVYGGFEAAVQAVATRPVLGWAAYGYYLPGVRLACDLAYRLIATYRYHLLGKAVARGECGEGTCSLHLGRHD
jgi:protein-S-isoprenylcysteine O-methyltransferase Ste14/predicted DCC family thiol-disulfide oxidoreductase YuxK